MPEPARSLATERPSSRSTAGSDIHGAMMPAKRGLNRQEAAVYLGIGVTTFDAYVEAGDLPKPKHFGRRLVWDRWELDQAFSEMGDRNDDVALAE